MLALKRLSLKNMDANQLADVLKIAPTYKQQENERWSSAIELYQRWSLTDGQNMDLPDSTTPPKSIPLTPMSKRGSSGMLSPDLITSTPFSLPPSRAGGYSGLSSPRLSFPYGGLCGSVRGGSNVSPGEVHHNSLELEAVAAVHELSFAVHGIAVSDMLPRTPDLIFVNLTSLEGQAYCLELTSKGWRVTSLRHDCMNGDYKMMDLHTRYFENVYALMDQISPGYREKFSEALAAKLQELSQDERDLSQRLEPTTPQPSIDEGFLSSLSLGGKGLPPVHTDPTGLRPPPGIAVRHPSGEGKTQHFPSSPGGLA